MKESSMSFVKRLLCRLPIRNKIILESSPDFGCNTFPVYLKLKQECPKTKLIWIVQGDADNPWHADGIIRMNPRSIFAKAKKAWHVFTAKGFISSNIVVKKSRAEQFSLFLGHGSKTKRTKGVYEPGSDVDYVQVQSHYFDEVTMDEYGCKKSQLVYLGYPRCDYFFSRNDKSIAFTNGRKQEYMIWLPTARFRKDGREYAVNSGYQEIGIPLVYSLDMLKQFNDYLRDLDMVILFKPHPVQDVSRLTKQDFSHFKIISDQDLKRQHTQLYELIAESTALITDYSSVFYDYLLLNRPIATTTDDIRNWKLKTGFAFDLDSIYNETTTRIADLEELKSFVYNVSQGIDDKSEMREKHCKLTNMYRDGHSTDRVTAFVKKLLEKNS